jgi:hypothetical protein
MRLLLSIFNVIRNAYSFSADPNLFGSKKRREEKEDLAGEFTEKGVDVEHEIAGVKTQNPFESAAAKSAMTRASSSAKQYQTRFLNTMGANASAESIVAAQGATGKAIGTAAGEIATGAEAMKKQELSELRGLKAGYEGQASGLAQSAIDERGSGWKDAFSALGSISGAIKGGIGAA